MNPWWWALIVPLIILGIVLLIILGIKITCYITSRHYSVLAKKDQLNIETTQFKFLQYNVFWRPTLLHMKKEEYMRERSEILLDRIQDFDFVCLDEAFQFGSFIGRDFVNKAQQRGFRYVAAGKNPPIWNLQVIDSGVVILSKLPIVETDCIRYSKGCDWDRFSAKGAVYAKIQLSEQKFLHVFASHLQSLYGSDDPKPIDILMGQFDELSKFMEKKVKDNNVCIVTGDLNVNATKEWQYNKMLEHLSMKGFDRKDVLLETFGKHPITFGNLTAPDPDSWGNRPSLDYVFTFTREQGAPQITAKGNINKMEIQGKPYARLSDHYAVEIDALIE